MHQIFAIFAVLEGSHLENYLTVSFSYLRYDVGHFREKKKSGPKYTLINVSKYKEKNVICYLMLCSNNMGNPVI